MGALKGSTPSQLEAPLLGQTLEVSMGNFWGSKGVNNAFTTGSPFMGTNLLDVSIGRDFGGSKGVYAFITGSPFLGTNLLEVRIRRDVGALKGLTPSLLEAHLWGHIERDLGALKGLRG